MRYVIIYTNDRTVQGHRAYYLVSGVNILLQGNVQRITPTTPIQVSTVVLNHLYAIVWSLGVNFIHVGNCSINFIHLNEIKIMKRLYFLFLNFCIMELKPFKFHLRVFIHFPFVDLEPVESQIGGFTIRSSPCLFKESFDPL